MVARTIAVSGKNCEPGIDYVQHSSHPLCDGPWMLYLQARLEPDAFPDPSVLESLYSIHNNEIREAVQQMVLTARNNGLSEKY